MIFKHKILLLFLSLTIPIGNSIISQNASEVFGKNKVQYNNDQYDWWIYETNNFVYYWYGKSKAAAQFCIEIAESENNTIQKLFEYHLKNKIELVVYADASDFHQSNIDFSSIDNEQNWNLEPKIKEQKILIYNNGDHSQLRNLLRTGITKIYFNSMFTGTALQDVIQKVISLRLPEWFENGLIQYLSTGWTKEDQINFNTIWKKNKFKKFSDHFPELAGKSFWNYLVTTYGEQSISNWLYMTRIQKDIRLAARSVFSESFDELLRNWYSFYINLSSDNSTLIKSTKFTHKLKFKKEEIITNIDPDFNQNKILIATQQNSRGRVYEYNLINKSKKLIFKRGSKTKLFKPDMTYPVFYQPADNSSMGIIYEKRNRIYIKLTKAEDKENIVHKLPEEIQKVYSAISLSKNILIISANINGFSDIIEYNLKTRQYKKLTNDIWDDLDVKLLKQENETKIIFRSNRPEANNNNTKLDSILPLGKFKLYALDNNPLKSSENQTLFFELPDNSIKSYYLLPTSILYNTEESAGLDWFVFQNGKTYNLNKHNIVMKYYGNVKSDTLVSLSKHKKIYELSLKPIHELKQDQFTTTSLDSNHIVIPDSNKNPIILSEVQDTQYFQSRFGNPNNIMEILEEFEKKKTADNVSGNKLNNKVKNYRYNNIIDFNSNQAIAYRNRFYVSDLSAKINNELLFSGLNTFSGTSPAYEPPPIGLLFKIKVEEIFENYNVESGLRIPTNFNGWEAYLLFENRKKRMDYIYSIYFKRNTETFSNNIFSNLKEQTNILILNYQLKYSIDHYRSIKAINTIRNDHVFYLSTNNATLENNLDFYQQRVGTRLEYVFDNAVNVSLNINHGWQAKVFFEMSKRFNLNPDNSVKFFPGALWITGFDARYHLPILRKSVYSNRLYSYISFGQDRILYHVGGTENWLLPKYENQNPITTSGTYIYSALATEVRSYGYGARKGSSVMGFSSELRIPFLQYLINENWKNNILRNFQLISFIDAAVVWDGFIPHFDQINTLTYHAENPSVEVDLKYTRPPYIAGIGLGLRTSLFGYFIRLDHGWKLTSNGIGGPNYSFSMGLDF